MPRFLQISPRAAADIGRILEWTELRYGEAARERYSAVLYRAIDQLRTEVKIDQATPVDGLLAEVFVYHLQLARMGNSGKIDVRRPRHYLVCRWGNSNQVDLIAVLHDVTDISNRLDDDESN